MNNKYKHDNIIPTEVLCKRLDELADAVTKGHKTIDREFDMRVPAELDRDADLVLLEASSRLKRLEVENEKLQKLDAWLEECGVEYFRILAYERLKELSKLEKKVMSLEAERDKLKELLRRFYSAQRYVERTRFSGAATTSDIYNSAVARLEVIEKEVEAFFK